MPGQGAVSRLQSGHVIDRVRLLDDPGTGGSAIGIALPDVKRDETIDDDVARHASHVTYPRALKIVNSVTDCR